MERGDNVVLGNMCENLPHEMVPMTKFSAFSSWTNCHVNKTSQQYTTLYYVAQCYRNIQLSFSKCLGIQKVCLGFKRIHRNIFLNLKTLKKIKS